MNALSAVDGVERRVAGSVDNGILTGEAYGRTEHAYPDIYCLMDIWIRQLEIDQGSQIAVAAAVNARGDLCAGIPPAVGALLGRSQDDQR